MEDSRSEMGDIWRQINEASKAHRTDKQEWSKELLQAWCTENSVEMIEIAPWHVRLKTVKLTLDIYPQRQKWHNVTVNKRGGYKDLIKFVTSQFQ